MIKLKVYLGVYEWGCIFLKIEMGIIRIGWSEVSKCYRDKLKLMWKSGGRNDWCGGYKKDLEFIWLVFLRGNWEKFKYIVFKRIVK